MAGITAAHYPFGEVDASPGHISGFVDVRYIVDGTGMKAHSELKVNLLQFARDGNGTLNWRYRAAEEDQGHSVSGRQTNEVAAFLGSAHLLGALDYRLQCLNYLHRLVAVQLRKANYVREENVRNHRLLVLLRHGIVSLKRIDTGGGVRARIFAEGQEHSLNRPHSPSRQRRWDGPSVSSF